MVIIQKIIPLRLSSLKASSLMHWEFESSKLTPLYFICGCLSYMEHTYQQYHQCSVKHCSQMGDIQKKHRKGTKLNEVFMFILPASVISNYREKSSLTGPSKLSVNTKQKIAVATVTESLSLVVPMQNSRY